MNPDSKPRSSSPEAPRGAKETNTRKQTPNTDMQAEDAGTAESGSGGRGTAVDGAMKQTSKTETERSRR